jgi:hypothetical protein
VWDWEGDQYDLSMYLTTERSDGTCTTKVMKSRYYAVTLGRLMELMREAGFVDIVRDDASFFQPLIIGVRVPAQ